MAALWIWISLLLSLAWQSEALGCLDGTGKALDYFVVYKLPLIKTLKNPNPTVKGGMAYAHMDNKHDMAFAAGSLTDSNHALAKTISQLYSTDPKIGYVLYNDQPPTGDCSASACGHTKGIVGFDDKSAFWILHSTPRFPERPPSTTKSFVWGFPDNEKIYGQNYICISLSFSELEKVADGFFNTRPGVYDSKFSANAESHLPRLKSVVGGAHSKAANSSVISFESQGGYKFAHLTKNIKWNKDIFESLIAPAYKSDFYVESWMRPRLESYCKPKYPYAILDVNTVSIGGFDFSETKDHSKWAIATDGKPMVCIGDINHQESQFTRSGGAICFSHAKLYSAYKSFIKAADDCKN